MKFPLLLAQGAEGIAVGLSAKILPHNFGELCDAAIKYLHGEEFHLYPDFQTGGSIDVSRYNDGMRGGAVKVRAKIEKLDNKTLVIREIPYGKTTSTLIDSILKANEKGKIKIRKVEDNTAAEAEIHVHLTPGTSSDKAIDALYAFTDCEQASTPTAVWLMKRSLSSWLWVMFCVGRLTIHVRCSKRIDDSSWRIDGKFALCLARTHLYWRTHL